MTSDMTVSFIVPTLNSSRYLEGCLRSIVDQTYPLHLVEIIVSDGGSTDETRSIAERFGAKIVENPKRTGEAAKAVGAHAASGQLLAFVDSDNELVGEDWLMRMTLPFGDPLIQSSEVIFWDVDSPKLSAVDRYCALIGVNDPLSLFLGNYGRYSYLTRKWTNLDVGVEQRGGYEEVQLHPGRPIPTMGANGFLIRREILLEHMSEDYMFDIDVVYQMAQTGNALVARVPAAIRHFFSVDLRDFCRKTKRRTHDFYFYRALGLRTYPWGRLPKWRLIAFIISCVTLVPLLAQALIGFSRRRDSAWFIHVPASLITFYVYSIETLKTAAGLRRPFDREAWRQ